MSVYLLPASIYAIKIIEYNTEKRVKIKSLLIPIHGNKSILCLYV